jgi:hypothetical protein
MPSSVSCSRFSARRATLPGAHGEIDGDAHALVCDALDRFHLSERHLCAPRASLSEIQSSRGVLGRNTPADRLREHVAQQRNLMAGRHRHAPTVFAFPSVLVCVAVSCCNVTWKHDAERLLEALELLGLISTRRRRALQGENFGTVSVGDVTECAAHPLTIDESRVSGERVCEIAAQVDRLAILRPEPVAAMDEVRLVEAGAYPAFSCAPICASSRRCPRTSSWRSSAASPSWERSAVTSIRSRGGSGRSETLKDRGNSTTKP